MTGSLQIKNEKYYAVVNCYENGKRKQKWIPTGLDTKNNKRRAEHFLLAILKNDEVGLEASEKKEENFSGCVRKWLEQVKYIVDEVTYCGYESIAKLHVLPYFDEKKVMIQNVTVDILQQYFNEKRSNGRLDGNGRLSPQSLRLHKNVINQTLKFAQKNGLISENPCEFVALPKSERFESTFYTAQQMKMLFKAIEGDALANLIKITAIYGLRRSEVLEIKKDSIDFENNLLNIKHTVLQVGKRIIEKDKTKNATSRRSFPLADETKVIFQKTLADEKENRKLFGKEYHENDYIFKWDDGKPFMPDYVTKHFSKLLEKNNLPHIRFHEIRHSCASLLLNENWTLKDVQEYLGHADITTTANIYGHLDVSRKANMVDKLSDVLS